MRGQWITMLGLVVLAACICTPGIAQTTTGSSVSGAGGGRAGNGLTNLHATFGQSITTITANGIVAARQGFWHTLGRGATSLPAAVTGVASDIRLHCAPNPAAATAKLTLELPVAGHAVLRLFDINGRLVRTLFDGDHDAGTSTVMLSVDDLAPGAYTAELTAGADRRHVPLQVVR